MPIRRLTLPRQVGAASRPLSWISICALVASAIVGPSIVAAAEPGVAFERDIRPILKAYCFQCHGEADEIEGQLDVRLRRTLAVGGDSGPALVPGKPDESLLLERIAAGEMPPPEAKKRPSQKEIALVRRWIAAGAPTSRPEPESLGSEPYFTEEERDWWAFRPIVRSQPPRVKEPSQVRTPIDAFILARLEKQSLSFSPEADRPTLIRRLYFDLVGLPPTAEAIEEFAADTSPDAYQRLVDELLDSPQYGERWGRHWLDVAGYADSEGHSDKDPPRKEAYRYRDYVIRALNSDKPLDQFIQEQLAGDEMVRLPYENLSPAELEKLAATGFLRMVPDGTGEENTPVVRNQVIADTLQVVSTALLGLTVQCARCHDHRYDPISHVDYHRLRAVFEPALDWQAWRRPQDRRISLASVTDRQEAASLDVEVAALKRAKDELVRRQIELIRQEQLRQVPERDRTVVAAAIKLAPAKRTPEQAKVLDLYPNLKLRIDPVNLGPFKRYPGFAERQKRVEAYNAQITAILALKPPEQFVRVLTEVPGKVPVTRLFNRGDHEQPRQEVPPGDLLVLGGVVPVDISGDDPGLPTSGRRLAFARHLTDGTHPLLARALMNRVWALRFGRGIVGTLTDFGREGELPTHPELLDWLASELPARGWSLKAMHRLMVSSAVYRQASLRRPELDAVDPDNRLLARFSVRRLEAEEVRDAMLAVAGKLESTQFGPPVPVESVAAGTNARRQTNMPSFSCRRSLYLAARRTAPAPELEMFDAPVMTPNCEFRSSSTVAPQSLLLLNSPFALQTSEAFADRVAAAAGVDAQQQARTAWRMCFGTEPDVAELAKAAAYLRQQADLLAARMKLRPSPAKGSRPKKDKPGASNAPWPADPSRAALASLCQALMGSNRFLYVH